jgi:hypothetical protein
MFKWGRWRSNWLTGRGLSSPFSLLRIEDNDDKHAAYGKFVVDLKSPAAPVPRRDAHAKKR